MFSRLFLVLLIVALSAFPIGCSEDSSEAQAGATARTEAASAADNTGAPTAVVGGRPGNIAPDFELANLQGRKVRLSDFQGNVVLVDFWATWCPPCRMSMPHFQEIHQKYGDRGVTVLGISMDRGGPKMVEGFIKKTGYTFQILMSDFKVGQMFGGVPSIPTTFVIGPDGKVAAKFIGLRNKVEYERAIKALKPELFS